MKPLLYDSTALQALFAGNEVVTVLWSDAELQGRTVLLPATEIAQANRELQATDNAWDALLLCPNVVTLDLSSGS